ncbi:MAG: HpcH/HpaI aldolase family protein [Citrobacter telavivensis]
MMRFPDFKQRLHEGPLHGCFVTFPSAAMTEFTAAMGFDFVLIDNEHGNMNPETVEDMVRASHSQHVPCLVRVPYNRAEYTRKALDFGADGVQVPLVNTAEDARLASRPTLFPPQGDRGVAFLPRSANYGMCADKARYLTEANAARVLSVHIETVEAVENLDDILAAGLADVYFIGPGDLAVSMGYGHDLNHRDVLDTIERCIRKIAASGNIAGTYVGTPERAAEAISWGANYLVTAITPHMVNGAKHYLQIKNN